LQGAARYPQIAAVWADGPSTIRAIDLPRPFNWATAVANTSNFMLDWLFTLYLGIEAPAPMIEIIPDIAPRPLMLVGGGKPHPYYGSEARRVKRYADFAGENAQVWVIPEAYHCDGPQQRPEAYEERLLAFFDRAFGLSDD
jgi:hypothetical protein